LCNLRKRKCHPSIRPKGYFPSRRCKKDEEKNLYHKKKKPARTEKKNVNAFFAARERSEYELHLGGESGCSRTREKGIQRRGRGKLEGEKVAFKRCVVPDGKSC